MEKLALTKKCPIMLQAKNGATQRKGNQGTLAGNITLLKK